MKKVTFIILAILLGIVVYFSFFSKKVEAPHQDNLQPEQINILNVIESKKQIVKEGYEIDFKFPVTGKDKTDSEIGKVVDKVISSFEEDAKNFLLTPLPNQRNYTLFANYEARLGSEYDTFVFLISIDFGGAHPNHYYTTITFDKDENVLSLQDVLVREVGISNFLPKISELSRDIISKRLGENTNVEMLNAGTEPNFDNFRNFYIDGESIVFLFEPYAVAPYAYSTQEAKILFADIF